jgi:hypothetical protein
MSAWTRTLVGAGVGGLYGASDGGGWGGAIGGAVGGGAALGMGYSWLMKGGKGRNLAGVARKGTRAAFQASAHAIGWGANRMAANESGSFWSNRGLNAISAGGWTAKNAFDATKWLSNSSNAASVNKYGSMALGALGVGAATHIGSSVLSSNRGF